MARLCKWRLAGNKWYKTPAQKKNCYLKLAFMEQVAFSFGSLQRQPAFVSLKINEGTKLDGRHLQEVIDALKRLAPAGPVPVLVDARVMVEATAEARAVAAGPELSAVVKANAILVNNTAVRLIANTFIWLNRPPFPVRVFTDEDKALEWLREC